MSYSMDPPQLLSIAERLRGHVDDLDEVASSLHRAMDAVVQTLARAAPTHAAFVDLAAPRADLAHRIVGRGRAAIATVHSAVLAYLTADDEMALTTDAQNARAVDGGNPFDPVIFGKRRL